MINIIINYDTDTVEIESKHFPITGQLGQFEDVIKEVLRCAYYSGERLCLEIKRDGCYEEYDRYQGLNG